MTVKILRKVDLIEVMRCFVVSNVVAKRSHKGHMITSVNEKSYRKLLERSKKRVFKMNSKQLERFISNEYKLRLDAYKASDWYEVVMNVKDLGTWKRAGELPLWVTNKSLDVTAQSVLRLIRNKCSSMYKKRIRARYAIAGIMKVSKDVVNSEKYLKPIVFESGWGTCGRVRLKTKVLGDIDDGNMRAITRAIIGEKTMKVYFGKPSDR